MTCPDELTLDLWLADALPSDEAAVVAAHVRGCATCAAAQRRTSELGAELQAALTLDVDESAFLAGLDLSARWRANPAATPAWGWIALASVVGGYAAWLVAQPLLGAAAWLGLSTVPIYLAFAPAIDLGQALLDVARHPAFGLTQPLLALFALALLAWPRQLTQQRSTPA